MRTLIAKSLLAFLLSSTIATAVMAASANSVPLATVPSARSYLDSASPYVVLKTAGTN